MKSKQILAALVLLVVLGGLTWSLYTDESANVDKETVPALAEQGADQYDRITIKKGERLIELKREGTGPWNLAIEPPFPADESSMKSLTDALAKLKLAEVVSSSAGDPATYELDPENAVEVTAWQGQVEKRKFTLGKSTTSGYNTFIQLPGDPKIYLTDKSIRYQFDKDEKAWKNKTMVKFDTQEAARLDMVAEGTMFSLESHVEAAPEGGEGAEPEAGTAPPEKGKVVWVMSEEILPVDQAKLQGLLSTFSSLRATDIVDGMTEEAAGLDQPWAEAEVELKDGTVHKVVIGNSVDETTNNRYARVEGKPYVYVLPKYTAEKFGANRQTYLQQQNQAPADPATQP